MCITGVDVIVITRFSGWVANILSSVVVIASGAEAWHIQLKTVTIWKRTSFIVWIFRKYWVTRIIWIFRCRRTLLRSVPGFARVLRELEVVGVRTEAGEDAPRAVGLGLPVNCSILR